MPDHGTDLTACPRASVLTKVPATSLASSLIKSMRVSVDAERLVSCVKVEVAVPAGLLVPNSPYGLCGRKATLNLHSDLRQELCESRGGRPGLLVPNSPYGLCGRKATLNLNSDLRSCVKVEVAVQGSPFLIVLIRSVWR